MKNEGKLLNFSDNAGHFDYPDTIVLSSFHYLSLPDLRNASKVCKQWNNLARTAWRKWLRRWETTSNINIFGCENRIADDVLKSCFTIGKEKWLPHPLARLRQYVTINIENAEENDVEFSRFTPSELSRITLFLRLNPYCAFTTRGKDLNDSDVVGACKQFWEDEFWSGQIEVDSDSDGSSGPGTFDSFEDILKKATYVSCKDALERILDFLHPERYFGCYGDDVIGYSKPLLIDEKGNVVQTNPRIYDEDEDEEPPQKEYGDDARPLSLGIYDELKEIFAEKSDNFISYCLTNGCFNENEQYGYFMLISDTAVFHVKQIFVL